MARNIDKLRENQKKTVSEQPATAPGGTLGSQYAIMKQQYQQKAPTPAPATVTVNTPSPMQTAIQNQLGKSVDTSSYSHNVPSAPIWAQSFPVIMRDAAKAFTDATPADYLTQAAAENNIAVPKPGADYDTVSGYSPNTEAATGHFVHGMTGINMLDDVDYAGKKIMQPNTLSDGEVAALETTGFLIPALLTGGISTGVSRNATVGLGKIGMANAPRAAEILGSMAGSGVHLGSLGEAQRLLGLATDESRTSADKLDYLTSLQHLEDASIDFGTGAAFGLAGEVVGKPIEKLLARKLNIGEGKTAEFVKEPTGTIEREMTEEGFNAARNAASKLGVKNFTDFDGIKAASEKALGLEKGYADAELNNAWREAAKKFHPDNKTTGKEAAYKQAAAARDYLKWLLDDAKQAGPPRMKVTGFSPSGTVYKQNAPLWRFLTTQAVKGAAVGASMGGAHLAVVTAYQLLKNPDKLAEIMQNNDYSSILKEALFFAGLDVLMGMLNRGKMVDPSASYVRSKPKPNEPGATGTSNGPSNPGEGPNGTIFWMGEENNPWNDPAWQREQNLVDIVQNEKGEWTVEFNGVEPAQRKALRAAQLDEMLNSDNIENELPDSPVNALVDGPNATDIQERVTEVLVAQYPEAAAQLKQSIETKIRDNISQPVEERKPIEALVSQAFKELANFNPDVARVAAEAENFINNTAIDQGAGDLIVWLMKMKEQDAAQDIAKAGAKPETKVWIDSKGDIHQEAVAPPERKPAAKQDNKPASPMQTAIEQASGNMPEVTPDNVVIVPDEVAAGGTTPAVQAENQPAQSPVSEVKGEGGDMAANAETTAEVQQSQGNSHEDAIQRYVGKMAPKIIGNDSIEQKKQRARAMAIDLINNIEIKDIGYLISRLHTGNKHSMELFSEVTGIKIERNNQVESALEKLAPEEYAEYKRQKGIEKEESIAQAQAQKEHEKQEKKEAKIRQDLDEAMTRHGGKVYTVRQLIDKLFSDYGADVYVYDGIKGPLTTRRISPNSSSSLFVEFYKKSEKDYIDQKYNVILDAREQADNEADMADENAMSKEEFEQFINGGSLAGRGQKETELTDAKPAQNVQQNAPENDVKSNQEGINWEESIDRVSAEIDRVVERLLEIGNEYNLNGKEGPEVKLPGPVFNERNKLIDKLRNLTDTREHYRQLLQEKRKSENEAQSDQEETEADKQKEGDVDEQGNTNAPRNERPGTRQGTGKTAQDSDLASIRDGAEVAGEPAQDVPEAVENGKDSPLSGGKGGTVPEDAVRDREQSGDQGSPAEGSDILGSVPAQSDARGDSEGNVTGDAITDGGGRSGRINEPGGNFVITDEFIKKLSEGGKKTKVRRNIAAIKTARMLETEGRRASPEEQETMAMYLGWGGLAEALDRQIVRGEDRRPVYDDKGNYQWEAAREEWKQEYDEIASLLTTEEMDAARRSTQNAHYTDPAIARAMHEALRHFGFNKGTILEPSMGSGIFFGTLSDNRSSLVGVELDKVTGLIAKHLYPDADIRIQGFQEAVLPDNYFDVAISNVPFGDISITDSRYKDKYITQRIHNYFFVKSLDKVRPGGIVAFITSSGTMNANDVTARAIRNHINKNAVLLGAIRLPSNAFKRIANTEVTTDIIFLRKLRDGEAQQDNNWNEVVPSTIRGKEGGELLVNNVYYANNPDMMLGELNEDKLWPGRLALKASDGQNTEELLNEAIKRLPGKVYVPSGKAVKTETVADFVTNTTEERQGALVMQNGKVYCVSGNELVPENIASKHLPMVKDYVALRSVARSLVVAQANNEPSEVVAKHREKLNKDYDAFVKKHGPISSCDSVRVDSQYQFMKSFEERDSEGNVVKAKIFNKNTAGLRADEEVEVADAVGAIQVCLNQTGIVDLDVIADITGKSVAQVQHELRGIIFKDPQTHEWMDQRRYLSGNVRLKLQQAQEAAKLDPIFDENVKALEPIQPRDLGPGEIWLRLGAPWIPADVINQFAREVLGVRLGATYQQNTGKWITPSGRANVQGASSFQNTNEYGTGEYAGHILLGKALNYETPVVKPQYDSEWPASRIEEAKVKAKQDTVLAQEMQKKLVEKFGQWVWSDAERTNMLVEKYNWEQNNAVKWEPDGSYLTLPGKSETSFKMRRHQLNAIARVTQRRGNALLAHTVGSGKTATMICSAMELRRLGLAKKPMITVLKSTLEQITQEFYRLYPNANVLMVTEKDFKPDKRKALIARIATGDWDCVVITHNNLMSIPLSPEQQRRFIQQQLMELEIAMSDAEGRTLKEMEKEKQKLEDKLHALIDRTAAGDDAVYFDELGVDYLFVDEAHKFKKLYIPTSLSRIPGIPSGQSGVGFKMHMLTTYLNRMHGGEGGVVFATGTPVTNSMAELYVMQKYLQPRQLEMRGLMSFDAWAKTFGEVVTDLEVDAVGRGMRSKDRFKRFSNVPEMMAIYRDVADIQTVDDLPEVRAQQPSCKVIPVEIKPSPQVKRFVDELIKRKEALEGMPPVPGGDNHLLITTDGKKVALDQRLVGLMNDVPGSKINVAVDTVFKIWQDTKTQNGTQLIFSDMGTPKKPTKSKKKPTGEDEQDAASGSRDLAADLFESNVLFDIYNDIRDKLVARGVPRNEIAFIHEADNETKKEVLFNQFNAGKVRVLLGSTEKMGTGVNVQRKVVAMHHLDAPYRPSDIEQRDGRGVRPGNEMGHVDIYRYVTKETFDAYIWQLIEIKAGYINQAMKGDLSIRTLDEVGESEMNASMMKAAASGNPKVAKSIALDQEIKKLKALQNGYRDEQHRLSSDIKRQANLIKLNKDHLARQEGLLSKYGNMPEEEPMFETFYRSKKTGATQAFNGKKDVNKAIADIIKKRFNELDGNIIIGFIGKVQVRLKDGGQIYNDTGRLVDTCKVIFTDGNFNEHWGFVDFNITKSAIESTDFVVRLHNALKKVPDEIKNAKDKIIEEAKKLELLKESQGKPWPHEDELSEKEAQYRQLLREIDEDNRAAREAERSLDDDGPAELTRYKIARRKTNADVSTSKGNRNPVSPETWSVRDLEAAKLNRARQDRATFNLAREHGGAKKGYSRGSFKYEGEQLNTNPALQFASRLAKSVNRLLCPFSYTNPEDNLLDGMVDDKFMYINTNSSLPGEVVAIHETVHAVAEDNPGVAMQLINAIFNAKPNVEAMIGIYVNESQRGQYKPADVLEEFAGDLASWQGSKEFGIQADVFMPGELESVYGSIEKAEKVAQKVFDILKAHLQGQGMDLAGTVTDAEHQTGQTAAKVQRGPPAKYKSQRQRAPWGVSDAEVNQRMDEAWGARENWREQLPATLEQAKNWALREFEHLPHTGRYAELRKELLLLQNYKGIASQKAVEYLNAVTAELNNYEYAVFEKKVIYDDLYDDALDTFDNGGIPNLPFGISNRETLLSDAEMQAYEADTDRYNSIEHYCMIHGIDLGQRIMDRITKLKDETDTEAAKYSQIADALAMRKAMWDGIKDEYIRVMKYVGFNTEKKFTRENYFRHQILDYMRVDNIIKGTGKEVKTPKNRGFLKQRHGSTMDFNTAYLEAEFEVVAQMLEDIQMARVIACVKDYYDYTDKAKAAALLYNREAAIKHLAFISSDPQKAYNKLGWKQAKAFKDLCKLADQGVLPIGPKGEWTVAVRALASQHRAAKAGNQSPYYEANKKQVSLYFSWLAKQMSADPWVITAKSYFKGIAEKKQAVESMLGKDYKDYRDFIPEGYEEWSPQKGQTFFMVDTIPEHLAKQLKEHLIQVLGVTEDKLQQMMAVGAMPTYIIPSEVKATLEEVQAARVMGSGYLEKAQRASKAVLNLWKQWQLTSPFRWFKYNFRNLTGDLDAMLAGNPSALKYTGRATKELFNAFFFKKQMTPELRQWFNRGGFQSLAQCQEITDINRQRQFKNLIKGRIDSGMIEKISSLPGKAWLAYWDKARASTDFREAVFRYACYLDYLDKIKKSETGLPPSFGASRPQEILGLKDDRDKAFKLSKDILGAYDEVSAGAQALANHLIPFFRFQYVNFTRYKLMLQNSLYVENSVAHAVGSRMLNLAKNAGGSGLPPVPPRNFKPGMDFPEDDFDNVLRDAMKGGGIANYIKTAGKVGAFTTWKLGALIVKALAFSLASYALCMLADWEWPDSYTMLSEDNKRRPLWLFFTDDEGTAFFFNRMGSLQDTDWLGLVSGDKSLLDFVQGQATFQEYLAEGAGKTVLNKTLGSLSPYYSVPIALIFGQTLYPDATNPRDFKDTGEFVAQSFGMGAEYRAAFGLPQKNGSYWDNRALDLLFYRSEPAETSYYWAKDFVQAWAEERHYDRGSVSRELNDKQLAIYYYKKALKLKDQDAADEYLTEYVALAYEYNPDLTEKKLKQGFQQSMETLDPLYGLSSDEHKKEFQKWFKANYPEDSYEAKRMKLAQLYYENLSSIDTKEEIKRGIDLYKNRKDI